MVERHTLRSRVPAHSVMRDVVQAMRHTSAPSTFHRLLGADPLPAPVRPRFRGALGELLVGDSLDELGPAWDILHAVPLGADRPEVDHLVVGPAGVYAITTANCSGEDVRVDGDELVVAGKRTAGVTESRTVAAEATAILAEAAAIAIAVMPLLVLVDPARLRITREPEGVVVLHSRQLVRWLSRQPATLDGTEVAHISDIADRDSTWNADDLMTAESTTEHAQRLHREFGALRESVRSAARIRTAWVLALIALGTGLLWGAVAELAGNLSGS